MPKRKFHHPPASAAAADVLVVVGASISEQEREILLTEMLDRRVLRHAAGILGLMVEDGVSVKRRLPD